MSEKDKTSKPDSGKSKDSYNANDLGKTRNFERIDTTTPSMVKKSDDSKPLYTPKVSDEKKSS